MYYNTHLKRHSKLYNNEEFDKYDNFFYLMVDKNIMNTNKYILKYGFHIELNINTKDEILRIYKENSEKFACPVKIIWGHFYNDFNEFLYHPVGKKGKIWESKFNKCTINDLLFINDRLCYHKKFDKMKIFVEYFYNHNDIFISTDYGDPNYNYVYIDETDTILFKDTEMLDVSVDGDVIILNPLDLISINVG